ncbi:MAG TPA: hypothetical protein VNM67_04340 [Thermoanaerobaculia bacterium]|jgi:hypothetical protein|nr:hypothetical protein [Thermoanaerobaculia bacterium]
MDQEIFELLQKVIRDGKERRELVQVFFRDIVVSGPLWLVPSLLEFVAREAQLAELRISRRIAGTIEVDDIRPF